MYTQSWPGVYHFKLNGTCSGCGTVRSGLACSRTPFSVARPHRRLGTDIGRGPKFARGIGDCVDSLGRLESEEPGHVSQKRNERRVSNTHS